MELQPAIRLGSSWSSSEAARYGLWKGQGSQSDCGAWASEDLAPASCPADGSALWPVDNTGKPKRLPTSRLDPILESPEATGTCLASVFALSLLFDLVSAVAGAGFLSIGGSALPPVDKTGRRSDYHVVLGLKHRRWADDFEAWTSGDLHRRWADDFEGRTSCLDIKTKQHSSDSRSRGVGSSGPDCFSSLANLVRLALSCCRAHQM